MKVLHFPGRGKARVRTDPHILIPRRTNESGEPCCPLCGCGMFKGSEGLTCPRCNTPRLRVRTEERMADLIPLCRCGSPLMYYDDGESFCPECPRVA